MIWETIAILVIAVLLLAPGHGWLWRLLNWLRAPRRDLVEMADALRHENRKLKLALGVEHGSNAAEKSFAELADRERRRAASLRADAEAALARARPWAEQLDRIREVAEEMRKLDRPAIYNFAQAVADGNLTDAKRIAALLKETA